MNAPEVLLTCLIINSAIAVFYFVKNRSQRRITALWRNIAAQREQENRQWRETNFGQRVRLIGLARQVRDFNLENEK